ncbi:hypothetical protein HELRODRAFT_190413 [Helobdella robusta]|uniref:Uncharacterized protein n=1 Tax=Helobdella robusta TaxID=6412 RepID=T1FRZ1_HELRO|nr:hypothetical protein HELRODRAFT_190413 [Helobdella robusta]ESO10218.1 hypothetical protein HELRODRAFT_190413 [Helobdella robusta]
MNVNFFHDYLLALIKDVASKLDIDSRWNQVAAVSFSDRANVEFYFTNFSTSASLQMAIDKISYGGYGTNLASALNLVRTSLFSAANGARVNDKTVSKAVVALINYPSDDPVVVLEEADCMRNESIGIFTVGSGSILNRFELAALASSTKNMATVDSSRSLPTLSDPIKRFACGDDNNCIINPCLNGGTCREIANQVICDCLPGWTGSFCNETCKNGGDIIFAIDASLGIESNTFFNVTNYIGNIVNAMNINGNLDGPSFSRVGLFTYDGNSVTTYFNFSTYKTKSQIIAALRVPFQSKSSSRIIKALETADLMFQREDRVNIPNYLVVVSDGDYDESNDGLKNLWLKSVSLREKGINILSVGIGSAPYMSPQLTAIASNGRSNALIVADAQSLKENSTVSFITNRLCNNINYCSSNLCKNPETCTSSVGNYFCGPCPSMTTGTYCERGCTGEIDLAFLLLSGGVVHRERFQNLTNFAISIVESLDISPQRTRVSLIFWANEAQVAFNLNSYTNKYDVIQAIKLLPYFMAGGNNMSGALRLLRRNVFNQANGDRPNVKNVAILVTNGPSTIDVNLTVPEAIQNRIDRNLLIPVALEANMFNSFELYGIASEPKLSTLVKVEFFRDLPAKVPSILQTVCNDCNQRLDVIILLDISGSTEEESLNNIALTKQIIYGLPIDNDNARVAMVAYSDDVSFQMTLDAQIRNKMNLINLIDFNAAAGKTNTPAGFDAIINNILNKRGDRNDVPNYVVVITDGESNVNQGQTIPKANIIKNGGSIVVAVGVGYTPNRDEIRGIATSDNYVFYYPPTKTAVEVANSILDKFCN